MASTHHHHHPGQAHPSAPIPPSILRLSAWLRLAAALVLVALVWVATVWVTGSP